MVWVLLISCLHLASCLAKKPAHHAMFLDNVKKGRGITTRVWSEFWVDEVFCIYPLHLQRKQQYCWWLQGEFAQTVCSLLSEGFYSGNCKTWVREGVKWIIYKLDMELICQSQKPVKAHVLPIAIIFCNFANCAAIQILS